ncbi:MAG: trimethylamine methyltransferase family protein [Deltaproteobacteria bacterium]|jgi:trimethylamine--corrinoid protein Co-methyltransferase|nr:trimethylamine methyltransferase family protein [Deltaproteobacteria bacterium]
MNTFRDGNIVKPYERLNQDQLAELHRASMAILEDPGIWCYNRRAAELFEANGAEVVLEESPSDTFWRVRIPETLITKAIASAPSKIILGARDPQNRLDINAEIPRVYFGSGSESNIWLETELEEYVCAADQNKKRMLPRHTEKRGSAALLCRAAHLCEQLEHLDFFIRPVNIQDDDIDASNHDVNKFFASLNNITKHVQAGLTSIDALDDVIRMAEIIAGGPEALRENPVLSFIACIFKSPLQLVDDTADKVFAIVEKQMPLVISSSPQGGSSAPIQEAGIVAQINAEILTGIALTQLIRPGAPVLYGSVPVRARLDDLHDLYGCPEFNQYNVDCVQLARFYKLPCYSSSGVGNSKVPGMQATFDKLFSHLYMAASGAQYIHYAFGLLDRTNTFSPLQAVLDNEQVGLAKHCMRPAKIDAAASQEALAIVRKVMATSHKLFTRHTRKPVRAGDVSQPYRFESKDMEDRVIEKALVHMGELESRPPKHLDADIIEKIYQEIPGVLPRLKNI